MIDVKDELPPEGQKVLAYQAYNGHGCAGFRVLRLQHGRAEDVVAKSNWHGSNDHTGNNQRPYRWYDNYSHAQFGQHVTHWMPLPETPREVLRPEECWTDGRTEEQIKAEDAARETRAAPTGGCGCMSFTRICLYRPGHAACVRGNRDPCEGCEFYED